MLIQIEFSTPNSFTSFNTAKSDDAFFFQISKISKIDWHCRCLLKLIKAHKQAHYTLKHIPNLWLMYSFPFTVLDFRHLYLVLYAFPACKLSDKSKVFQTQDQLHNSFDNFLQSSAMYFHIRCINYKQPICKHIDPQIINVNTCTMMQQCINFPPYNGYISKEKP